MKKIFSRKVLGYIALAMVCVLAGTALGMSQPAKAAEKVVVTSPFTEAVAKVQNSVVGVYNYQLVQTGGYGYGNGYSYGNGSGYGYGFPFDEFFNFGFGNGYGNGYGNGNGNGNGNGRNQQPETSEVKYASGSGVVIAKEYVLTNYHVIEDASSLKISLDGDDNDLYDATAVATDADKDLAVLYVPGLPLEPVALGDSDELVVGDWAICIGNAVGFTGTVTAGIISALDREIESDTSKADRFGRIGVVKNTMIQTDAAINNGNSGGGMFNTAGELVGIPTLKYSGTRSSSGLGIESIGMCIPINEAKDLISQALSSEKTVTGAQQEANTPAQQEIPQQEEQQVNNGRIGKPRLGVTVQTLNTRGVLPNGAYIVAVEAGSPAEKAGLKPGDTLVELNGQVISSSDDLMNALEPYGVGDTLKVTVWRPTEVNDAANYDISLEGSYIENIEVGLAMLDNVIQ